MGVLKVRVTSAACVIIMASTVLADEFDDSVWRIKVGRDIGTAFLISERGYFITAHHLVRQNAEIVLISPPPTRELSASVVGSGLCTDFVAAAGEGDPCGSGQDVAVLKAVLDGTPIDNSLTLHLNSSLDRFEGRVWGFRRGSTGRVNSISGNWAANGKEFHADQAAHCGYSGGPLVEESRKQVVGVQSFGVFSPPSCRYVGQAVFSEALQTDEVRTLLSSLELDVATKAILERVQDTEPTSTSIEQSVNALLALDDFRLSQVAHRIRMEPVNQTAAEVVRRAYAMRN